jgi:ABC-2 type transport system ATP-binding protein
MAIIEVKNLHKTYQFYKKPPGFLASLRGLVSREKTDIMAVEDVNFSIEEGELVGFLGPNGAGKTTTLKMLSGIIYPTSGSVKVLGYVPSDRQSQYQKQFAIVMGQKNQLWWDLPPMETFVLIKEIYEIPDKQFKTNLNELVKMLDIKSILDIQVRKLSLGQRMKCELAAALLHTPKILFLDEPTIGLDVVAQNSIRNFIKYINKEKKTTIILTSHYMDDISKLCKRVIIIDAGRIVFDGKLTDLIEKHSPHKLLKITFEGDGIIQSQVEPFGNVLKCTKNSCTLEVSRSKAKEAASNILSSGLPVDDIMIDEVGVDDVIRKIFSKDKPL